jgi:hypothetical protein
LPEQLGVHDAEVQPELVPHLVVPLQGEPGRADNQHGAGAVAQHQLLHHQPGFNGFAQTDVIGNQQVGARHGQRAHHRVELVVLDLDAGAERRLQRSGVGRGDRAPAHRMQKRRKCGRLVKAVFGARQHPDVVHYRTKLQLPDDAQLLVPSIVRYAGQSHQMGCPASEHIRSTTGYLAPYDIGRDPLPVSHRDELARHRSSDLLTAPHAHSSPLNGRSGSIFPGRRRSRKVMLRTRCDDLDDGRHIRGDRTRTPSCRKRRARTTPGVFDHPVPKDCRDLKDVGGTPVCCPA